MTRILIFAALTTQLLTGTVQAAPKAQPQPQQKKYKTTEPREEATTEYFRGAPFAQSNNLSFGLGLNYFAGFGLQARYAARVIDKGPIPDVNNSLYIEGGIGLTLYGTVKDQSGVTGTHFLVTGRWDFQADDQWILFGDLGLGYNAVSNDRKKEVNGGGFFPAVGVGAMYNLDADWSARADLSYQFLGVGILRRF